MDGIPTRATKPGRLANFAEAEGNTPLSAPGYCAGHGRVRAGSARTAQPLTNRAPPRWEGTALVEKVAGGWGAVVVLGLDSLREMAAMKWTAVGICAWAGAALIVLSASALPAAVGDRTPYVYGIHTWSSGANGLFHGRRGWSIESTYIASYPWNLTTAQCQQITGENFELVIRLNKEASRSVPVTSGEWDQFAADCAAQVNTFKPYCNKWIIGNEMNANFEANIPAASYVEIYRRCRAAIRAVQPDAVVIVAAVAPWNASQNPGGPYTDAWSNYMDHLVANIGDAADGYAIHAYGGRGGDTDPRDDTTQGFGIFKRWMAVLDAHAFTAGKPVYLTEMNHAADGDKTGQPGFPKYDYAAGYINRLYEAVNTYNQTAANRIRCACWFSYSNGGFPGYNIAGNSQMQSDFSWVTQNTSYFGTVSAAGNWLLFE